MCDNDRVGALPEGLAQQAGDGSPETYWFHDECFPELRNFQDHRSNHIARFHNEYERYAIDSLDDEGCWGILNEWVSSSEPPFLVVEDHAPHHGGSEKSTWTSDFTMEMMDNVLRITQEAEKATTTTLVTHFCGALTTGEPERPERPEMVIQHLLFQLLKRHEDKFTDALVCQKEGLTRSGIQGVASSPANLWTKFRGCTKHAGVQLLIIMLDGIESMLPTSPEGKVTPPTEFLQFIGSLESFLLATREEDKIDIKLLVTGRGPGVWEYFSKRHKMAVIESGERSGPPPRRLTS